MANHKALSTLVSETSKVFWKWGMNRDVVVTKNDPRPWLIESYLLTVSEKLLIVGVCIAFSTQISWSRDCACDSISVWVEILIQKEVMTIMIRNKWFFSLGSPCPVRVAILDVCVLHMGQQGPIYFYQRLISPFSVVPSETTWSDAIMLALQNKWPCGWINSGKNVILVEYDEFKASYIQSSLKESILFY